MTLEKPCTLVRGLTFLAIHANFLTEKKEEIMSEIPPVRRNWRLLAEVLQTEGHPAILDLLAIESRDGILDAFSQTDTYMRFFIAEGEEPHPLTRTQVLFLCTKLKTPYSIKLMLTEAGIPFCAMEMSGICDGNAPRVPAFSEDRPIFYASTIHPGDQAGGAVIECGAEDSMQHRNWPTYLCVFNGKISDAPFGGRNIPMTYLTIFIPMTALSE